MSFDLAARFDTVSSLVREHRDIIETRVTDPEPPEWVVARGWNEFLRGLPDEALACGEADGLRQVVSSWPDAPTGLVRMLECVAEATQIPLLDAEVALDQANLRKVKERKRWQLSALLAAAADLAQGAKRIVDVGAGQGHLTRVACRAWDKEGVGLDREAPLVDAARTLAVDHRVSFRRWDAFREELQLNSSDLVMGLHACGEVGDVLVRRGAEAGARVLLVSCCPQKVRGTVREPLSAAGRAAGLTFVRGVLGLANLSQLEQGVETSLSETMQSRETRHAMRLLLRSRGLTVAAGEEMRGVNRRQAYRGLRSLADKVLAYRGLAAASWSEIHEHEAHGRDQFRLMRRLSLPRTSFARLIEVAVVLDRAMFLHERGYRVQVAQVFDLSVSPRNLGIFAVPQFCSNAGSKK